MVIGPRSDWRCVRRLCEGRAWEWFRKYTLKNSNWITTNRQQVLDNLVKSYERLFFKSMNAL